MKAIILKEAPKYFLEKCKGPKTPHFKSCQEWLINFFKNRTRESVCDRINDVLDLIRIKMNNIESCSINNYTEVPYGKDNYTKSC